MSNIRYFYKTNEDKFYFDLSNIIINSTNQSISLTKDIFDKLMTVQREKVRYSTKRFGLFGKASETYESLVRKEYTDFKELYISKYNRICNITIIIK